MQPNPFDPQTNIDNILKKIGVDILPPEQKQEVTTKLIDRIQNVILITAINLMTPEQKRELEKAMEDPDTADDKLFLLGASIPFLSDHIELALETEIQDLKHFFKIMGNK